ncbi:MAG: DUF2911 domain-containing protein [Microscillaceae bacterium]|nr:DUF2911 domain-containing protein [Microscillaceae bacterium]
MTKYRFLLFVISLAGLFCFSAQAQLTLPEASPLATVSQRVGLHDVQITYSRPSVRGREVWGSLVPYGFTDPGFGTAKSAPWRTGANANTIITFAEEMKVEGKSLPAGSYGLHMAIAETGKVTVIFSKNTTSWGSYYYDEKEDALRVEVQWEEAPLQEQLLFTFDEVKESSAIVALRWEKKRIPFSIEIENFPQKVLNHVENELRSNTGFYYQSWVTAAELCLQYNIALDKALVWAESAVSNSYYGEKNFISLSTKAAVLSKLGRASEAKAVMAEALPMGNATDIYRYGRQLLSSGDKAGALEVFQQNEKMHPKHWLAHLGMARGFSAKGDFANALKHAKMALNVLPEAEAANRANVALYVAKLEKKEDIN